MRELTTLQEIQVNYKRSYDTESITCSSDAERICRDAFLLTKANISLREYFYIVLLNRANECIGFYQLSSGGLTGTVADIRLAFSIALKCLASGMIITHCHPSGRIKPSQADIKLTQKFKEAGKILDVTLLDHIILTENSHYSFADEGLL